MKSTEEGYAKLQRLQQEKSRTEDIETARQEQCDKLAPILLQKAATSYDAGEAAREAVQAIQDLQYDSDKVMADIDEGANGNEHQYAGAHPFNRPGSIVRRPQSSALIGAKAATATPPNIFGSKKPASLALGDDLSGMKKDTITKTDSNGRGKRRRSFGMDGNAESAEYSDLIKDENKRQKLDADNQKPANCMGPTTPVKKRETVMDILHEDFKNPTPPIVPNARMMTGYGFNLGSPTPIDERRDIGDDILQHLGDNSWHFGNIRHGDRGWFGYAGPNEKTLAPHREETARMIARHDALMGDGGAVAGPAPIFDGGLGEMAGFAARASSPVKGADPFSRDVYMADADRTAESGVIDTSSKAENSATDSGVFLVGKESFLLESQPGRGASPQKDIEMEDGAKDVSDYGNAASDEVDATLVKGRQTSSEQLSDLEDVDMIEVNESAEADGADTAINTALPPSSPSSPGENGQLRNLLNAGTAGSSLVSDSAARNSGGNSDK